MYKAKKSYGQHFLTNDGTASRIANLLLRENDLRNVLEVGPGQGMLTKHLICQPINLKVIEADDDMVRFLHDHYPELASENIIAQDFLKANLTEIFQGEEFCLIGNFPYNISSQIVFKMMDAKELIPEMVGMFQREVADRIIAPPGNKVYGVISVLTQAYYEGSLLMKIPPGAFNPPPKVNSAVIRLKRKAEIGLNCNEKLFKSIVKVTFGQRRKMLRNTLKAFVRQASFFSDPSFDRRPEQLGVEEFIELTHQIENCIKNESGDENHE